MVKNLSIYIEKIINELKEKGRNSKKNGWVMSEILKEVENRLGKDASKLARKLMIQYYENI